MAEYTGDDIQVLAEVIADALARDVSGAVSLARVVLGAGWRRQQEPVGYLVRISDDDWHHCRPCDVEALVPRAGGNPGAGQEEPGADRG